MAAEHHEIYPNPFSGPDLTDEELTARFADIRKQNDHFRTTGQGGRVIVTEGVISKGQDFASEVVKSVAAFTDFNTENTPWTEHDCAALEVQGEKIIWKIDYYDQDLKFLSPDPSDPKVTILVLTIMLAGEY